MHYLYLLPATAFLTAVVTLALIPMAVRMRLVDQPGGRKSHQAPTPLAGGPALFAVLAPVLAWALPFDRFVQAISLGIFAMVLTGMIDDRRHLSAKLRLVIQIGVCLAMIYWADVRLSDFGRLMWDGVFGLGWLAVPVTVFAALGVINSFNMIDGMDGLAGAIFLVAAAGMTVFAALAGQTELMDLLLVSMAAVIGFMMLNVRFPWNPKARVFLGDAGSLMLGFILAWCTISLGSGEDRAIMPMTAVWLVAVPLLDTSTLMWRRWQSGQSAFEADRFHLHHAFLRAGYSVTGAWALITLLALVLAAMGVIFEVSGLPEYVSFYVFMVVAFGYYFYMKNCWQAQRLLGRDFIYQDFQVEEVYE